MRSTLSRYPVAFFVTLTLGFQLCIVLIAHALLPDGKHLHEVPDAHMLFRFRVFGPLVFASAITWYLERGAGIRRLFGAFKKVRAPGRFYLLALSWKFMFTYIGAAILVVGGVVEWPGFHTEGFLGPLLRNMPFIVGIALVEETSWMKFSVTRLQERYSAFWSCVLVGLAWGLWYLPMLILGEGVPDGIPWWVFLIHMFSLTVMLGWMFNETQSGVVLLIAQIIGNCAFFILPVLPGWHHGDPLFVSAFVFTLHHAQQRTGLEDAEHLDG
mgnify:FL=1